MVLCCLPCYGHAKPLILFAEQLATAGHLVSGRAVTCVLVVLNRWSSVCVESIPTTPILVSRVLNPLARSVGTLGTPRAPSAALALCALHVVLTLEVIEHELLASWPVVE